jgi:hypothetical protein
MSEQIYQPGDEVYLLASAKRGFLERYAIDFVTQNATGKYVYHINIKKSPPNVQSVGGAYDQRPHGVIYYDASELITYCDALVEVISYHTRKLNEYQQKLDNHCE